MLSRALRYPCIADSPIYIIVLLASDNSGGIQAPNFARLVHEQLVFLYLQGASARDKLVPETLSASWFFLELTIKAMIEHLATTARYESNKVE